MAYAGYGTPVQILTTILSCAAVSATFFYVRDTLKIDDVLASICISWILIGVVAQITLHVSGTNAKFLEPFKNAPYPQGTRNLIFAVGLFAVIASYYLLQWSNIRNRVLASRNSSLLAAVYPGRLDKYRFIACLAFGLLCGVAGMINALRFNYFSPDQWREGYALLAFAVAYAVSGHAGYSLLFGTILGFIKVLGGGELFVNSSIGDFIRTFGIYIFGLSIIIANRCWMKRAAARSRQEES
jgi:ABC-type uncharacterized transport system permease subunit